MAAELKLAALYARDKGKNSGGADKGWICEGEAASYFLQGRVRVVPVAVIKAHATLVPDGVS